MFSHFDSFTRKVYILNQSKVYHKEMWWSGIKMDKRIMVVDDDPDILISIRRIFEEEGYEVFTVDSGEDCIKELERGFKGVVLMDIMMPFMDGWDTIEEIKRKGLEENIIINIFTAKGTQEREKMNGLESYIHDYIAKPYDVKQLISNIGQMIAM